MGIDCEGAVKLGLVALLMCGVGAVAEAKPLLSDSQKSMTAACIAADEKPRRLVQICEAALEETGGTQTQRVQVQVSLAHALYDLGELDQSQTLLQNILEEKPDTTRALSLLGWIAWDQSDYVTAAEQFDKSLMTGPTSEALAGHASSLRRGGEVSQTDFATIMDAAIALSPGYLWAMREKAWGLLAFGDLAAAEKAARAAWAVDKGDVHSLYLLGYVFSEQGRWKEAYGYLNSAVQMSDAPTQVFSQKSLVALQLGYFKLSLKDAERVIADWPEDSIGYVRKARALEALGRRAEGIASLREILAGLGHDDFAVYWLADLIYSDGDTAQAASIMQRTFDQGEPDYHDHEFMALLQTELANFDAAEVHIEAALGFDPEAVYPHFYRALGLVAKGAYDPADELMKHAASLGLPEASKRWYLSELTAKGQFVRAIQMRLVFRED